MPALLAQKLSKHYPTSGGARLDVLVEASLSLDRGDTVAILGPSGSGKSTLLSILGTLDRPSDGSLEIDGVEPYSLADHELAGFRSRHIGFVFQEHHLLPQCTVLENVLIPLLADGTAAAQTAERAVALIGRVGLANRLHHRPAELSGGERQRAALARALIRNPTLLLADEPTGNLDRSTGMAMVSLMLELQHEQQAMLIAVTHSERLAAQMQQRFELDGGRLLRK